MIRLNKIKPLFLGYGKERNSGETRPVLNGMVVFKLMDSQGIPLEIIVVALEMKGLSFDVFSFLQAAKLSKNFTKEKLHSMFVDEAQISKSSLQSFELILERVYRKE